MKKPVLAVAAVLASLVPLAVGVPAHADTDRGDYESFHHAITAPRASIDVLTGGNFDYHAHDHRILGKSISVKLKDVRTVKQSRRFMQFVTVQFSMNTDFATRFLVRRGGLVFNGQTGQVCNDATSGFNDATNTIRVFVPDSCINSPVFSAQAKTALIDKKTGFTLATDEGTLYEV